MFMTALSGAQCCGGSEGAGAWLLLWLSGAEGVVEPDIADCSDDRGGRCYRREVEMAGEDVLGCDVPRHIEVAVVVRGHM